MPLYATVSQYETTYYAQQAYLCTTCICHLLVFEVELGKNFDCQLDDVVGRFEKIEQNIYLDQNH